MAPRLALVLIFTALLIIPPSDALFSRARRQLRDFFFWPPRDKTYDVPTSRLHASYDFIIVGAGSSGAVVANRLTEVPEWSVLVLEAGGEENMVSEVPLWAPYLQTTEKNWGYRTEPQQHSCLAYQGRRCPWPRGKSMGGTSAINYMLYTRGHQRDYDDWERLGNSGWGWRNVMNYYLKSESADGAFSYSSAHNVEGPLSVCEVPHKTPLARAFLESAREYGQGIIDYNSGEQLGSSLFQVTLKNGSRCSTNRAFLRPIRYRTNFNVAKNAHVTKVLINPKTRQAYGVEFLRDGKRWLVKARREVILSAGAVNTPQLLMLSGIGPGEHLDSLKIKVVSDLPGVGQNLQDHMYYPLLSYHINDTVSLCSTMYKNTYQLFSGYMNGVGALTVPAAIEGIGYLRTKNARTSYDYPDIEIVFSPFAISADYGTISRRIYNFPEALYKKIFDGVYEKEAWTITPVLLQPESVGSIRLRSKNPLTWPIMDANYFSNPNDVEVLMEGIKETLQFAKSRAFSKYNSTLYYPPFATCDQLGRNTDPYWRCMIRHFATTAHHQCGTAKMGPAYDTMAVVDPALRVYGVKGLRVIDASVIPRIPAAHTNAPAIMIGERGADIIKEAYGKI